MPGCNCRKRKVTIFRVEYADGTQRRFLTEAEAKAAKREAPGSHYRALEV